MSAGIKEERERKEGEREGGRESLSHDCWVVVEKTPDVVVLLHI